jgi:acetyl-CoA acetyltransferase
VDHRHHGALLFFLRPRIRSDEACHDGSPSWPSPLRCPRGDTSLEKPAKLPAVFHRSSRARSGNSSPLTDGSASIWVGDEERLRRLGIRPMVKLIDREVVAVDVRTDGMLRAPARAIPRLLARNRLRAEEVAVWEIHEAFAAADREPQSCVRSGLSAR